MLFLLRTSFWISMEKNVQGLLLIGPFKRFPSGRRRVPLISTLVPTAPVAMREVGMFWMVREDFSSRNPERNQ